MSKKLTIPQRLVAKTEVAELYMKGFSSRRIALGVEEACGIKISGTTVLVMIKEISTELQRQYEKQTDALFWVNLEKYNNLEAKMWEAWELSKTQRRKTTSKKLGEPVNAPNGTGVRTVRTKAVTDQEELTDGRGDPRYAAIILECIDKRMEWIGKLKFGITPQVNNIINNTNNNVQLNISTPQLSPKMAALAVLQPQQQPKPADELN